MHYMYTVGFFLSFLFCVWKFKRHAARFRVTRPEEKNGEGERGEEKNVLILNVFVSTYFYYSISVIFFLDSLLEARKPN